MYGLCLRYLLASLCLLGFFTACAVDSRPLAVTRPVMASATHPPVTAAPLETGTPEPATETAVVTSPTAVPATAVPPTPERPATAPAADAGYFTVGSWSPDSRWLAYWASTPADVEAQQPYTMPGGTLHFWDIASGEACAMPQFRTASNREGSIAWDDDAVIIVTAEGAYSGQPCQAESFAPTAYQPPQTESADPALSPDGRYRIQSTQTANQGGILTYKTRLTAADDGRKLAAVTWQIDQRLGDYNDWLGGEWVSPTQFIIYETRRQGPLLLDAEQGVVSILTDLLTLDTIPSMEDEGGYSLTARPIFSPETNTYHLLISGVAGLEDNFPPAQLYHAENGLVETLPYAHVYWQLGQDTWLFLDSRPLVDGHETQTIWMRRLEAIDAEWQLLASDVDATLWNEDRTELVFTQGETAVIWQTFPAGEILGQWETSPYWTRPISFSPDGRFVVSTGNKPGQWAYGLFILQR